MVCSSWVNSMFVGDDFPKLSANLKYEINVGENCQTRHSSKSNCSMINLPDYHIGRLEDERFPSCSNFVFKKLKK